MEPLQGEDRETKHKLKKKNDCKDTLGSVSTDGERLSRPTAWAKVKSESESRLLAK